MSIELDWSIDEIRKNIDKLNENLSMIAYQLYLSNNRVGQNFIMPDATIKNFLLDREKLNK